MQSQEGVERPGKDHALTENGCADIFAGMNQRTSMSCCGERERGRERESDGLQRAVDAVYAVYLSSLSACLPAYGSPGRRPMIHGAGR